MTSTLKECTAPHWSPDFEFQVWQQAADASEITDFWQSREIPLDADTILVLDAETPIQDEFLEFLYD